MKSLFIHSWLFGTKKRAWTLAFLFILWLFGSAPWIGYFSQWLRGHRLLFVFFLCLSIGFLLYIFAYFLLPLKITQWKAYVFVVFLILLALFLMRNILALEERIHFLEYALLGLFLFKAAKFSLKGSLLFGIPLMIAMTVGWLEELWQGLLPTRIFDWRDIYYNSAGGILGICLAWIRQKYAPQV